MMTKVVNFRDVKSHWNKETQTWDSDEYVYIGRRNHAYRLPNSPFANFAPVRMFGREGSIEKFRISIARRMNEGTANIELLRGKTLVCWCKGTGEVGEDVLCHGDVLRELLGETANESPAGGGSE
jgi:hypothetical protein